MKVNTKISVLYLCTIATSLFKEKPRLYISSLKKKILLVCFLAFTAIIYKLMYTKQTYDEMPQMSKATTINHIENNYTTIKIEFKNIVISDMKYILLWTNARDIPFNYLGNGQTIFQTKKCRWTNCYVTDNRRYLGDYTEFDVVAFNGPALSSIDSLPQRRRQHQKYVFASIESADNYPVCNNAWDEYFNWTWTYKLDSDALWSYFIIRNLTGDIIGPSRNMQWLSIYEMEPIDESMKEILNRKTKAAAWFVSNCNTKRLREDLALELQRHLIQYGLFVDVYGECGNVKCPRNESERCDRILEKDYYFYLAFENAFGEDYVTEKVLHALNHNTVPIVYGNANYTRFMPKGIYLNARELGPKGLAYYIHEAMKDRDKYYQYFRWKQHYSFHLKSDSIDTDDYCNFCAVLNDVKVMKQTTVYNDFKSWWSPNYTCPI